MTRHKGMQKLDKNAFKHKDPIIPGKPVRLRLHMEKETPTSAVSKESI